VSSLVTKAAESPSFRNLCFPVPTASETVIEKLQPDIVALQEIKDRQASNNSSTQMNGRS
jgi:endonuclease/exonuclease/phosphatase family metal-dependent hydrolase